MLNSISVYIHNKDKENLKKTNIKVIIEILKSIIEYFFFANSLYPYVNVQYIRKVNDIYFSNESVLFNISFIVLNYSIN